MDIYNTSVVYDLALIGGGLLACLLLWLLAGYAEKVYSPKFRLLYLVPAALCLLITLISGVEPCMAGAYIGSAGLAFGFFRDEKKLRRISSVVCALVIAGTLPFCIVSEAYRDRHDYLGDFEKGFASMKAHYALAEHKQIDWDALYAKYLPQFKEVQKTRDKYLNVLLWSKFCTEFYDGHVNYSTNDVDSDEVRRRFYGGDYGLVINHTSDGGYAALCVDKSLEKYGIHNGTRVISWNGESPDEADKRSEIYECLPLFDLDNEEFYKGMYAAMTGGDASELRFIADDGTEQTVQLPKLSDSYSDRFHDFNQKMHQGFEAAHMSVTKINDTTACLRVKYMMFDSKSSNADDHTGLKSQIRDAVNAVKDEGVKDIIIDCRSNGGGSGDMVKNIVSLFAPEGDHYYCTNPVWDEEHRCYAKDENGNFLPGDEVYFEGENIMGDGRVILLVNDECASAGDHITKVMHGMPNVTEMGFTKPAGVGQGVYIEALENGSLCYSSAVMLDRDGSFFIDAGADKHSTDDIDIIVPFDDEAIHAIFDEGKDYLMDKALELLAGQK